MTPRQVAVGVLLPALLGAAALSAQVPEPPDYRTDVYRAPVPATLTGATVIDTDTAEAMWEAGEAAFVDVMPRPPRPQNLPAGTVWRDQPRDSIPGAIWLPNVGYGTLAEVMDAYFRAGLETASGGDPAHPLVFFCLEECWMSWNAAKRALEYGYGSVFWYPEGTDGWTAALLPLERAEAVPGDR